MDQSIRNLERASVEDPTLLSELKRRKIRDGLEELESFKDYLVREKPDALSRRTYNTPVSFGDSGWMMSIQCSSFHYSSPREDLEDPKAYSSYELALCTPTGLRRPPEGCPHADCFEPNWSPVAGYLTADQIQDIFRYMYLNYGEPATLQREEE